MNNTALSIAGMDARYKPVPPQYRGVWRRTLLQATDCVDTTTTVLWLQTSCWHADIRIPANRPDFLRVRSLAECNAAQLAWLAQQQGFAGITHVDSAATPEICTWHRVIDFQPAALTPDAGFMQFEPECLVETGVHAAYLEHWSQLSGSTDGFAVFRQLNQSEQAAQPMTLLLIAGDYVMHVRDRRVPLPASDTNGTTLADRVCAGYTDALDFEISFGRRTLTGWIIDHSTLPYLEGRSVSMRIRARAPAKLELEWDDTIAVWEVLEWTPPR